MTFTHALATNNYGTAKFIVSATSANGTHTTIASAITSASSGDTIFIRPGTYTENLTLKVGVNLSAYTCDSYTGNVIILGNCTLSTAGTVTISGIQLKTNSANNITVSGSVASILNLINCNINCSNNTGLSFTSSSASSQLNLYNCTGDLGTTGIALFASSSAGSLLFTQCAFTNSGGSSTANTISAGALTIRTCVFTNAITGSSTSSIAIGNGSFISTAAQNVTALTIGGSGAQTCTSTAISSGTASAVSISTALGMSLCVVNSSNTNAITGAGAITYAGIVFGSTSNTINVTTQTGSGTLQGSTTTAPSTGFLGEQIRSALSSASAITLSNATSANVTSISLTAGVWDVTGSVEFSAAAITGTSFGGSINTVSATVGTIGDNYFLTPYPPTANSDTNVCIPPYRIVVTTTTITYLVAVSVFTVGTLKAYGRISATRVG